jgi:hypothetical protein
MLKHVGFAGIAFSSALALVMTAGGEAAAAKTKKMSYEAAFAKCKQELGGGPLGAEGLNTAGRYSAAGGCMKKYGYRLKK